MAEIDPIQERREREEQERKNESLKKTKMCIRDRSRTSTPSLALMNWSSKNAEATSSVRAVRPVGVFTEE